MWKVFLLIFSLSFVHFTTGNEIKLGDECESYDDCDSIPNAVCNVDDECECDRGYTPSSNNKTCLPLATKIGDKCEIPEQCSDIPSAECVGNVCVSAKAVMTTTTVTTPIPTLTKPQINCTKDSECSYMKGVCTNGTCAVQIIIPKVETLDFLGKMCSNDSECKQEGASCIDKVCRCKDDYIASQNLKTCLPKAKQVGDPCNETAQCISLNGSICENQKCTNKIIKFAKAFETAADNVKTPIMIGSSCQTNDECKHLQNSICKENVCQCTENYITSVLSNSCLLKAKKEGDACELDKQCEDIKGAYCSMKKCVKPGIAGSSIGNPKSGSSTRTPELLTAAILFVNFCFLLN